MYGASSHAACSGVVSRRVDPGHELAVGAPCGGKVLVAFLELEPQVSGLLLEEDGLLLEVIDVVGGAEPGIAPGLLAEQLGLAFLELLDAGGQEGATPLVPLGNRIQLVTCRYSMLRRRACIR